MALSNFTASVDGSPNLAMYCLIDKVLSDRLPLAYREIRLTKVRETEVKELVLSDLQRRDEIYRTMCDFGVWRRDFSNVPEIVNETVLRGTLPLEHSQIRLTKARDTELPELYVRSLQRRHEVHGPLLRAGPDFSNVDEIFQKCLPVAEQLWIKNGGKKIFTADVKISLHSTQYRADITWKGESIMPSIPMVDAASFKKVENIQIANIVMDVVQLAMGFAGVVTAATSKSFKETMTGVIEAVMDSVELKMAVDDLGKVLEGGGSLVETANAIFIIIKETKIARIFLKTAMGLKSEMSKYEAAKSAAILTASLVAELSTAGYALIAKIVLALNEGYDLKEKFATLKKMRTLADGQSSSWCAIL